MNRPTSIQSKPETARFEPQFAGPCGDVLRLPAMGEHIRVTFFLALLKCGLPAAIIGRIVELPVFSSDGMISTWPWSHISKELRQSSRSAPLGTHGYSARAVFAVTAVAWTVASTLHGLPTPVAIRPDELPPWADNPIRISARDAAAGFRVSGTKVHGVDINDAPAVAPATPSSFIAGHARRAADHREAIVFFSSEIEYDRHLISGLSYRNQQKRTQMYQHFNT